MNRLRLLVVSRGFWPISNDRAYRLLYWTGAMVRAGVDITVLTPRWHPNWPMESDCREVHIQRLSPAPKSSWSESNFLRACGRWIAKNQQQFDLVYIDDADSSLIHLSSRKQTSTLPLLGRFSYSPQINDNLYGLEASTIAAINSCRKLDAVIVPNSHSHRLLASHGIQEASIIRIDDVAWNCCVRDEALQSNARAALSRASGDLMVPRNLRLILAFSSMSRFSGLETLCKAVGKLLDQDLPVRMWIVGSGPELRPLHALVREHSWHRDILFQGNFDTIDDLLQATDLCVIPNIRDSQEYVFPSVVCSGTPWLAIGSFESNPVMGVGCEQAFMEQGNRQELVERLKAWIENPRELEKIAKVARKNALIHSSVQIASDAWLETFRKTLSHAS